MYRQQNSIVSFSPKSLTCSVEHLYDFFLLTYHDNQVYFHKKKNPTWGRGQLNIVLLTPPHREDISRVRTAPNRRSASVTTSDRAINLYLEEELACNFGNSSRTDGRWIIWIDSFKLCSCCKAVRSW